MIKLPGLVSFSLINTYNNFLLCASDTVLSNKVFEVSDKVFTDVSAWGNDYKKNITKKTL